MAAFFQSLHKTLAAGFVILIVIIILAGLITGHWINLDRGLVDVLHALAAHPAGVMWIGLLWYFNFVQTPSMPKIDPRSIAPRSASSSRRTRCSGSAAALATVYRAAARLA